VRISSHPTITDRSHLTKYRYRSSPTEIDDFQEEEQVYDDIDIDETSDKPSSIIAEKESLEDFEEDWEEDILDVDPADEDSIRNDFAKDSTPFATHEVSIQDIVSLALHDMAVKYKGQCDYVNA